MAFARPTLSDLVTRVQADMVSRLQLAGAVLRRSVLHVLSRVIAGASHMLHGHIEYLGDQLFADTSDAEHLRRHAGLYGIYPRPATFAEGAVTLTGTNGTVIPMGTALVRADGAEYETQAEVTITGGSAWPVIEARVAGAAGNTGAGVRLTLMSPISGASSDATVGSGGLTLGTDEEDLESLRSRFLARLREPPQGGSATDYEAWALEVPGVERAWVYPGEQGAGTVVVRFLRVDGIPNSAAVAQMQAHLDERRPVTAQVVVLAPVAWPVNFSVSVTPNNATVRAAVADELADLFDRVAAPGATILLSQMLTAIGTAPGVEDFTLHSPTADVTNGPTFIPQLGTITWV